MEDPKMYKSLAKYYDLVYSFKNYRKEAQQIRKIVSKYKRSEGKRLLDIACGTGNHLRYLKNWYLCTGVDLNSEMLNIAKKRLKGINFRKADMERLNLGRKYDIITLLFSSIGYMKTLPQLKRAINGISKHLTQGGIAIIEPWILKSNYKTGSAFMTTYDGKGIKIARLNVSKRRGNLSVIKFHYLIAERNKDVRYITEMHEDGLFDLKTFLGVMRGTGLEARFLRPGFDGRGLFVGVKR